MAQRFSKALRKEDGVMSRARVYADVNVSKPKDYWDYETLSIQWGWDRPVSEAHCQSRSRGSAPCRSCPSKRPLLPPAQGPGRL